jgi:hypothetical protein
VPNAEADEMMRIVQEAVTRQQGCKGCSANGVECRCCWHVRFVGGARRRGQTGHDADLLIYHHAHEASWGPSKEECTPRSWLTSHLGEADLYDVGRSFQ